MLHIPYKNSYAEVLKGKEFRVYPNPTDNYLWLDLSTMQTKENLTYRLLNSRGAIVKTSEPDGTHEGDFFISQENLTNGIYFLEALEEGKSLGVQRVVKNSEANRYRF